MTLDWLALTTSPITRAEIVRYIPNEEWQALRVHLLNTSLATKYAALHEWLREHDNTRASQVQVTNYINALKRGGMIK